MISCGTKQNCICTERTQPESRSHSHVLLPVPSRTWRPQLAVASLVWVPRPRGGGGGAGVVGLLVAVFGNKNKCVSGHTQQDMNSTVITCVHTCHLWDSHVFTHL